MGIVYTRLERRPLVAPAPVGEIDEAVQALLAHATPDDGLEHASGRIGPNRIDLLLYLLPPSRPELVAVDASQRAADLLARSHRSSPLLNHRYLPPAPTAKSPAWPERPVPPDDRCSCRTAVR